MASEQPVFVTVDVGTSGARAVAVDLAGRVVAQRRRPYATSTPAPGRTEQDPRDWEERAVEALAALAAALRGRRRVAAVGLTGQCPTIAPLDARGRPTHPAILYLDNRSVAEAEEMRALLGDEGWHRRTGQVPAAFYVGPAVLWLRRHEPSAFARTRRLLQPRDVVLRRLTGVEATDETHAGATLFYDLERRAWATDLLQAFDLDPALLPAILAPTSVAGTLGARAAREVGLARGTPVVIGAADSLCAAFGAGASTAGPVSEMAGSSSCLNSSVAERVDDPRVTLYSHVLGPGYLTELGVNTAGAAIDWAVRRLGFGRHAALSADAERFDRRLSRARARSGHPSEAAPLFVPYLGDGERNDPAIRGALVGLSHRHDRPAIAYAVLEGVAFALRAALGALEAAGCRFDELRVSGGAARAAVGSRVKADVLGRPVTMLTEDTTAIGCALLAAVGTGHEREAREAVAAVLRRSRRYEPRRARDALQAARAAWFADVRESPALRVPDGPGAVS